MSLNTDIFQFLIFYNDPRPRRPTGQPLQDAVCVSVSLGQTNTFNIGGGSSGPSQLGLFYNRIAAESESNREVPRDSRD